MHPYQTEVLHVEIYFKKVGEGTLCLFANGCSLSV